MAARENVASGELQGELAYIVGSPLIFGTDFGEPSEEGSPPCFVLEMYGQGFLPTYSRG